MAAAPLCWPVLQFPAQLASRLAIAAASAPFRDTSVASLWTTSSCRRRLLHLHSSLLRPNGFHTPNCLCTAESPLCCSLWHVNSHSAHRKLISSTNETPPSICWQFRVCDAIWGPRWKWCVRKAGSLEFCLRPPFWLRRSRRLCCCWCLQRGTRAGAKRGCDSSSTSCCSSQGDILDCISGNW